MSKYPPNERVTAGKLAVGDLILIKDGISNGLVSDVAWADWVPFEPGLWTVDAISSYLQHGNRRRATRVYVLTLRSSSAQEVREYRTSSVQRLDRVVR